MLKKLALAYLEYSSAQKHIKYDTNAHLNGRAASFDGVADKYEQVYSLRSKNPMIPTPSTQSNGIALSNSDLVKEFSDPDVLNMFSDGVNFYIYQRTDGDRIPNRLFLITTTNIYIEYGSLNYLDVISTRSNIAYSWDSEDNVNSTVRIIEESAV